ncbi:hypothetical protein BDZ89DRAFT_1127024 [Hymenopellis radicata]|nr:hypothetical protein BDZ89DRAFT_1127024 [Hymenopellis radicata]
MSLTSAPAFRQLLSDTDAVVSSSSALAFFNIGSFVGADLDIYADFASFPNLASYGSTDDYPGDDSLVYLSSAIVDVFTFMTHAGKKVQVIASRLSFMHTILSFHSALVMNFVTATHAICLYPYLSFIQHVNARAAANGPREFAAHVKYASRGSGWPLLDQRASLFLSGLYLGTVRMVGDKHCWVHRHSGEPSTDVARLDRHSWRIKCLPNAAAFAMKYTILRRPGLEIQYCCDYSLASWM